VSDIRNICIIAHVDHGKTTLVDYLLTQSGTFSSHEEVSDRVMDSGDIERERGITISAKNASFQYKGTKVNVVDTPGHADFGGEVERIMSMVDGAVLLVDAAEGPMPQTRFVLQKAIEQGLKIILCINKVDRPEVMGSDMIDQTVNKVFDLFVELGASDEQTDFPIVYACARAGWAVSDIDRVEPLVRDEDKATLEDLFDMIVELPEPKVEESDITQLLIANISYSEFLGGLAIGKIRSGELRASQPLELHTVDHKGEPVKKNFTLSKLFTFNGTKQMETERLVAGDIAMFAGAGEFSIGDTVGSEGVTVLPRIEVEEPTMRMIVAVNTGPKCGKEGKAIQSRELRERLEAETRSNVALRLVDTDQPDQFYLLGRGELQFGIIIETLRREGLEVLVGRPNVLYKDIDGERHEPYEHLTLDLPEWAASEVTSMYQQRKGVLMSYEEAGGTADEPRVRLVMEIPTRGILGTNSRYKTLTKGAGLASSELSEYKPHCGTILHRLTGSLIADRTGKSTAYSLNTLQQRGELFITEGTEVYEGMIIGECAKDNDLNVNPVKPKKLTNVRASGSDGLTILAPPKKMPLERCIEWIDDDEWIEVTPESIRLRKKVLPANQRSVIRSK
jgi:GTP-binding protein